MRNLFGYAFVVGLPLSPLLILFVYLHISLLLLLQRRADFKSTTQKSSSLPSCRHISTGGQKNAVFFQVIIYSIYNMIKRDTITTNIKVRRGKRKKGEIFLYFFYRKKKKENRKSHSSLFPPLLTGQQHTKHSKGGLIARFETGGINKITI